MTRYTADSSEVGAVEESSRSTRPLSGDLIAFGWLVTVGLAGYACLTSIDAPRRIIYSGCIIGRDEPFIDLYRRVPCILAVILVMAGATAGRIPALAKVTRCASLASAAIWALAVSLARGWW
jgi:hypothetical protein